MDIGQNGERSIGYVTYVKPDQNYINRLPTARNVTIMQRIGPINPARLKITLISRWEISSSRIRSRHF